MRLLGRSAFISRVFHSSFTSCRGTHPIANRRSISYVSFNNNPRYRTHGWRTVASVAPSQNDSTAPNQTVQTSRFESISPLERDHANEPSIEALRAIPEQDKPGVRDDVNFPPSDSVNFWRSLSDTPTVDEVVKTLRTSSPNSATANIWMHVLIRSGFFRSLNMVMGFVRPSTSKAPLTRRLQDLFSIPIAREILFSLKDDIDRIESNVHSSPWDLTFTNKRYNPIYVLNELLKLIPESRDMLNSMQEGKKSVWINNSTSKSLSSKQAIYPDYYLYGYHHQPEGWLSSQTANSYELLTETLFNGRQDAMQRLTFHSLSQVVRNEENEQVVELAAGTGRFSTFVRDNYRNINLHVSELSPFFLEKARANMKEWSNTRKINNYPENTHFIQAQAEKLPFDDASIDVVYGVYLFHELPPHARIAVVKEAARVLKKNGHFIITDSVQLGDRNNKWDYNLGNFSNMNEPWYKSYLSTDFGELLSKDGLFKPVRKDCCSATKTLMFRRSD